MLDEPVVRPINELLSALSRAPLAAAATEDKLAWLGEVVARLLAAIGTFTQEPAGVLAAQRSLLVMPGLAGAVKKDLAPMRERIRPSGPETGITQLLDSGPRHHFVKLTPALSPEQVVPGLRPIAGELTQLARELQAIDDLAYALDDKSELSAGALVLEASLDLGVGWGTFEEAEFSHAGARFVAHRALEPRLATLLSLRRALDSVDDGALIEAERGGVLRALALWVLAVRTARGERLEASEDRNMLDRLLESAGLAPVEVFDAATLWLDLDAGHLSRR